MPWYWFLKRPPLVLETQRPSVAVAPAPKGLRAGGAATVEVWGDDRLETLRLLRNQLDPGLAAAFRLGLANSIGSQVLGEIMAMGADFRPPSSPSVWYNVYRPLDPDPVQVRIAKPFSNVTVSVTGRR